MGLSLIRPKSREHFLTIAGLHASSISSGFLSTLGIDFLTHLYEGINRAPESGVLIAVDEVEILGFLSFSRDIKTCYRSVLKEKWFQLAIALLPRVFHLPIYQRIGETLFYPLKKHSHSPGQAPQASGNSLRPELLSMAVAGSTRGKGVGKSLVKYLDEEMARMQVEGYFVVTHGTDERSNGFYQRCGFVYSRKFYSHGKPMVEYYKVI